MFIIDKRVGDVKILGLNGRIDSSDEHFDEELKELIRDNHNVLLDCENLNYINSYGMRCFLSALKEIMKRQGKMVFCRLNENVKHVFQISGFTAQLEIYETYDEAMAAF